jgi:hypothetical protein
VLLWYLTPTHFTLFVHKLNPATTRCHGCSFVGSRSRFEKHLGSGAKKANQHIFLREEQISLKVREGRVKGMG